MFGQKLYQPWLSPSGTAEGHFIGFTRAKLPVCATFCSGTGLRSRNYQTCPTRFRISKLGNQVQIFDTFNRGFSTFDKIFALGQLLKVVQGYKNSQMFIQTKTSPRLEIIARWGCLPISMVLRSERSLKLKMLSLAWTSKYVNDTNMLSIKTSEEDS